MLEPAGPDAGTTAMGYVDLLLASQRSLEPSSGSIPSPEQGQAPQSAGLAQQMAKTALVRRAHAPRAAHAPTEVHFRGVAFG